jgi:hypothetical protein
MIEGNAGAGVVGLNKEYHNIANYSNKNRKNQANQGFASISGSGSANAEYFNSIFNTFYLE